MSNIAYVRVSTVDQNEARQLEALERYRIDKWFIDKKSGKDQDRPELIKLLDYVRDGDTVYIKDFSRLARSTKDLLDIIDKLASKGVTLASDKENIDTSTANGKLMLTMLGAIYEFERANILERQREGIEIAKREGRFKGRKKVEKPKDWDAVYSDYISRKCTGVQAMERLNLKKGVFYKFVEDERA